MKKKAFLVNGIILTLSSLAGRFLYMGFRVWLSQMIGPEGMGAYQLILSVFLPAVAISTAGVSLTVTRLVTSAMGKKQPEIIPSAVARCCGFSLIMSLTACVGLWCSADFLSAKFLGGNSAEALRMLIPGLPFMALSACMRGYFLAVRGVLRSAASEFAEQLATISLTVFVFLTFSPRTIADACLLSMLGATVGEAVSCGCSFILYRLHVRQFKNFKNRPCTGAGKAILHITLPSTLSHAARSVLSAAENLLIVEDIVDSGRTLKYLVTYLLNKGAKSVKTVTLLDKPERREVNFTPEYVGKRIENHFVIGYGLDYGEKYRNLPYVGVIKPEFI